MERLLLVIVLTSNIFGSTAIANSIDKGTSWIDDSVPIFLIEDKHRQAEAWGICSAAWTLASKLLSNDSPAKAQQFEDTARGASLAVGMTYVVNGMKEQGYTPDKFQATWSFAKTAMQSIPESQLTRILAKSETSKKDLWLYNHMSTLKVCDSNMEGQQFYIDSWRDLATSGLLALPD